MLRVALEGRETAAQTRQFSETIFAEREKRGVTLVLLVVSKSRPIFKVEEYGLSGMLERIRAVPGMRVAVVADDRELHAAHQYIEVLAAQRGVAYRAFTVEREALDWLRLSG